MRCGPLSPLACATASPSPLAAWGASKYGQTVPLAGGAILDLTERHRMVEIDNGIAGVEAGTTMNDSDRRLGEGPRVGASLLALNEAEGNRRRFHRRRWFGRRLDRLENIARAGQSGGRDHRHRGSKPALDVA